MPEKVINKKLYVIGAGAIGGLVGGYLTRKFGKENVILVDTDKEHVKAIRDRGLKIYDKGQKYPHQSTIDVSITTPNDIDVKMLDNVILATKSYSNSIALKGLRKEISMLILQNGYDEKVLEFPNAVRGVEFGFACKVDEPGHIFNAVKGKYVLGSSNGVSKDVEEWARILNSAGIKAETKVNIDGYLWSKLLINSALNPVSAVTKYSFKELIDTQESRELFKDLYKEGYPIVKKKTDELGQKLGSFIGPPNIVNLIFQFSKLSDFVLNKVSDKFGQVESSMLQDIRRARQTEVDHINGAIIRLGEKYGIETPKNKWIYQEIKKLEPK
jgi:2-dehydropantoate 2-reductase